MKSLKPIARLYYRSFQGEELILCDIYEPVMYYPLLDLLRRHITRIETLQ